MVKNRKVTALDANAAGIAGARAALGEYLADESRINATARSVGSVAMQERTEARAAAVAALVGKLSFHLGCCCFCGGIVGAPGGDGRCDCDDARDATGARRK